MFNVKLAKRGGGLGITISRKFLDYFTGASTKSSKVTELFRYYSVVDIAMCLFSVPPNRKPGDPLVISEVRKGSVAHRSVNNFL